jgi:GR25 family glycosyltransferase involved in LPS biosynthesis
MSASLEIAIVSLPDSNRRRRITQWMDSSPHPWRFFNACRAPAAGDPQYDAQRATALHGTELQAGEIGCFASHFHLLKEFEAASRYGWLLVVEDDVLIDLGFPFDMFLTIAELADLNYLKLYSRYMVRCRKVGERILGRSIVRFHGSLLDLPGRPTLPLGTQGYLISREGASRFIRSVGAIIRPVDWQFDRYWENGLGSYAVFPYPLMELVSETTITSTRRRAPPHVTGWFRYNSSRFIDRLRRRMHDHELRQRDEAIARAINAVKAQRAAVVTHLSFGKGVCEASMAQPDAMNVSPERQGQEV